MKKILKYFLILILLAWVYLLWYIYAGSMFIPPHYHANFAVYQWDKKIDFSDDTYMEDVSACSLTGEIAPKDRAHLHENNGDTIHIHADGVAWGHFFWNIGYIISSDFIKTDASEILVASEENTINFMLNGKKVSEIHNRLIRSKDRLLVAYWNYSEDELSDLFETVSQNAWEYNSKYDPGSCWGTNENGIIVMLRDLMHWLHSEWH